MREAFEEWMSNQSEKIEVDCGCVTTEAFYHWLKVAYEATPQPAHTEQDGWKIVPNELTPEMRDAWDSAPNGKDDDVNMSNAYRAMLAAAPKPDGALINEDTKSDSWIKCSERLPERKPDTSIEYLVYEEMNGRVQHDYWNVPDGKKAYQAFWNHYGKSVTHWMPLPPPPKPDGALISEGTKNDSCQWNPDEDSVYSTGCGNEWQFTEGGLEDNKIKFCPYCSGKIAAPKPESER